MRSRYFSKNNRHILICQTVSGKLAEELISTSIDRLYAEIFVNGTKHSNNAGHQHKHPHKETKIKNSIIHLSMQIIGR
jgi:hypothetical protein